MSEERMAAIEKCIEFVRRNPAYAGRRSGGVLDPELPDGMSRAYLSQGAMEPFFDGQGRAIAALYRAWETGGVR